MAGGADMPEDIAPLMAKQQSQKPADLAFALHQQIKANKKLERRSIKRLGNEDVEVEVPGKMKTQFYRNETTSRLKDHYGMFSCIFAKFFMRLTCFSRSDGPQHGRGELPVG
jgi:hypothetical protein